MHLNKKHASRNQALLIVGILIALFVIPFFIAWFLFKDNLVAGGKTNYGFLITPPMEITELKLFNDKNQLLHNEHPLKDETPTPTRTDGRWLILAVQYGPCDKTCEHSLYNMRQVRIATGKNMNRVERVLLIFSDHPDAHLKQLIAGPFAGTHVLHTSWYGFQHVIRKYLPVNDGAQNGAIYLVDPFGNVIMYYSPTMSPDKIFKDFEHLLQSSQIG